MNQIFGNQGNNPKKPQSNNSNNQQNNNGYNNNYYNNFESQNGYQEYNQGNQNNYSQEYSQGNQNNYNQGYNQESQNNYNQEYNQENQNRYNQNNNYKTNNYSSYNIDANYKKTDINKILKIFSFILIAIGVCMIAKSGYAISVNKSKQKDNVEVLTDKMGKELTITINTNQPIKEFSYKWNSGEETKITGDGTVSISRTIDIPNGNNVLKITVVDFYGNKTDYMKQYLYESSDSEKPTIEIAKVGNKLKITAKDNVKISYLTYSWNDGETERIDAPNDSSTEISTEIDVEKGENKLYVTAVDGEDNRQTRSENIIAAKVPTFAISTEGTNIVINAKDEVGIKNITIVIDGKEYSQDVQGDNQTDVKGTIPVSSGTHNIKVTVTNTSGLQATDEKSISM